MRTDTERLPKRVCSYKHHNFKIMVIIGSNFMIKRVVSADIKN